MKFGEKYELLESLTTGGVETFVANDKVRGERVLVHILEGDAQKPNQPTVQWVLEAFRRAAPEPAGLVLETGRYSGTLYAYLVTKMPDESALAKWVQLYKSQGRDTQDISSPVAKPSPESDAPTATLTSKEASRIPGAGTPTFRESGANARQENSSVPSKEAEHASPSLPSQPPTARSAGDRSPVRPAPDWNAVPSRISGPAKADTDISGPANSFRSAFNPPKFTSETNSTPVKDGPGPGEFTSFFQGPFRVEGPSESPAALPQPIEPPRKTVREFTAMFNSPLTAEPSPAAGVAGNEPAGAGFTGWFGTPNIGSRTSGTTGAPPPSGGLPRPGTEDASPFLSPQQEPFVPPQPASYVTSTPPIVPLPTPPIFTAPPLPKPAVESHPAMQQISSPSDAATHAFNRPVREVAPSQPAPPSGPSPYTQVISLRQPGGAAGEQREASPNSTQSPTFPAASLPPLPAIAPPPIPTAPAMPKIAAPPAPKAPKLDQAGTPQPPVSCWPLILTLTVLFFIAVLLVVYFALKH